MKFDSQKADTILSYIRAGGYPQVAAEAAGVHRKAFLQWVERGEKAKAREPYRSFAFNVRQAAAMARVKAEMDSREKDVRFWLTHGLGRETPDYPGWAGEVKPADLRDPNALPALDGPEWNSICHTMLEALDPFPEARLALAEVLQKLSAH
jgi:hypothetical protein